MKVKALLAVILLVVLVTVLAERNLKKNEKKKLPSTEKKGHFKLKKLFFPRFDSSNSNTRILEITKFSSEESKITKPKKIPKNDQKKPQKNFKGKEKSKKKTKTEKKWKNKNKKIENKATTQTSMSTTLAPITFMKTLATKSPIRTKKTLNDKITIEKPPQETKLLPRSIDQNEASEKHNETAKMAVEENEKSQTNETGNNVQGGGISIVNNTQTNSNNVNNTFNNINNNNFYIFGNQLEEIMSHFPASPPHLDLPPPPLPPLMFGCENEDYEWRLVSKQQSSSKPPEEEKATGGKMKCRKLFENIHEILNKNSDKAFSSINTDDFSGTSEKNNQSLNDSSHTSSTTSQAPSPETTLKTPGTTEQITSLEEFSKLKSVSNAESMMALELPEGSVVYREDLQTPFIKTDRWRSLVLSKCGDGRKDVEEECDDGNRIDTDACKTDCTLNVCGDGVQGPYESCDGEHFLDIVCGDRRQECSADCLIMCLDN